MISHAIFASSHLTLPPPRTASSSVPPSTSRLPPRASPHISPCTSLHIPPCTPTIHPIMRFTQHLDPHPHPYPSAKSLLPPIVKPLPPSHSIFFPSTNFPSASLHPPCSSAKPRLWIFSCVKRPGPLTT